MQDNSDLRLIIQYLHGDEKSLEFLIRQYLKPIYGFVYRFVGNPHEAHDVTQEVLVKMWRNLRKFDQNKNFKTWLFSIAKNTCLDYVRKKKAVPFSHLETKDDAEDISGTIEDPAPLPSEFFDNFGLAEKLNAALQKLAPLYCMVFLLYYHEQFTFQEIAEILEEPLNTVKSRHRRGIMQLRAILAPKDASQPY